jgi:exodeoxyribonuclease VII small subunit
MELPVTLEELLTLDEPREAIAKLPFEHALKLLEELVTLVESGSLPLDRSLASYERGVKLITHLRALLTGAEERLRVLQKGEE